MTDEEAWELKAGDQVEVCTGSAGKWAPAVVVRCDKARWGDYPVVAARRTDTYRDGKPYKRLLKASPRKVRKRARLPRLPANVYADWLDERGESKAAAMLREAFPLDDGTG
jgi:uncharacterized protein (TIGR02996 family)